MKSVFSLIIFFSVFLLLPSYVLAHPIINEVYPVGSDDWVEIHNPVSEPAVELSQYVLRDSSKTNKVILSGSLSPGGFAVFAFGNKLNNGGDTVKLVLNSDNSVVNELSYGKGTECVVSENQSVGLSPSGKIGIFTSPSKGQQNTEGTSCVKATSTPPSIEPTAIPTTKPTIEPIDLRYDESEVKAASIVQEPPTVEPFAATPSAGALATTASSTQPDIAPSGTIGNAVIGVGGLCILVAIAGFLHIGKKRYNEKHAQESR